MSRIDDGELEVNGIKMKSAEHCKWSRVSVPFVGDFYCYLLLYQ